MLYCLLLLTSPVFFFLPSHVSKLLFLCSLPSFLLSPWRNLLFKLVIGNVPPIVCFYELGSLYTYPGCPGTWCKTGWPQTQKIFLPLLTECWHGRCEQCNQSQFPYFRMVSLYSLKITDTKISNHVEKNLEYRLVEIRTDQNKQWSVNYICTHTFQYLSLYLL